jgi:sugar (pentulose or hexulose) kinase
VTVRLPRETLRQIDRWRRAHGATRAQAIQRLIRQALRVDAARPKTQKAGAARAAVLAGQAIDRQADPSADAPEQARRKRKLIKGPRELRRGVRRPD